MQVIGSAMGFSGIDAPEKKQRLQLYNVAIYIIYIYIYNMLLNFAANNIVENE